MKIVLTALFLVMMLPGCGCETVQPGTVGVAVDWGELQPWTYSEGFHVTGPFMTIHPMSTRTETYTMAGAGQEAEVTGSVSVVTRDQLTISLDVSVQYHLNGAYASDVYRFFGENYADSIVHSLVRTSVRDAASEFEAIALIDDRALLQSRMEILVRSTLASTLRGRDVSEFAIVIDNILLRNIDLPQSLEESIANVQRQHQETQQRIEALATARAESDRLAVEATGQATARLTRAHAEADSNRIIAESLTPQVLRARQIELMASVLANEHTRTLMLPTGATPLFNLPTE